MFKNLKGFVDHKLSTVTLWLSAITTFILSKVIQIFWLDKSYIASKYPVPFYEGQTTFDAAITKSHYQVLIDEGTLGVFWQTQFIDFIYLMMTFIFTFLVMAAIYKMFSYGKLNESDKLQKFSWFMALTMPLNAVMDMFENLTSFIMLSNPLGFADWLIYPYSSFAVAKFAFYGIGYLWIILAILIAIILKIVSLFTSSHKLAQ